MVQEQAQGDLFPDPGKPAGAEFINERCVLRTDGQHRVVLAAGIPIAQYSVGDRMAEAHAMVSLVDQGWADQNDVARAFGCSPRTLRRYQRRLNEGGLAALGRPGGYPKGRQRLPLSRTRSVQKLKMGGLSNRQIAVRLGVTEKAVRKLLRRLRWTEAKPTQASLPFGSKGANPNLSAFSNSRPLGASEAQVEGADPNLSAFPGLPLGRPAHDDPADRSFDRLMACLGLLDDADPMFRPGTRVHGAGVLLAIPAVVGSGVLAAAQEVYGTIGPAFYGLRTTVVALILMALLRIKRPEGLKERSPHDLGRILGLDRAPEVKTLRRKLARLAGMGQASRFGHLLARRRVETRGASMGFLYIDGHVRVYHGKHTLPKAHVARMRLSLPATTDYWVNDKKGEPLFVVTAEANAGLVRMLPPLLEEVRGLVGERRVTVVFDRGGWSPALFQKLIAQGFDILTYRKGRSRRVPTSQFRKHTRRFAGKVVTYVLSDRGIRLLEGKLRLRQVTRLSDDGHQTPIITSRRDLTAIEVAYRMFERWRQENFFKYLREEFALDALAEYAVEPADPAREVPNPVRRRLDERIRRAREALFKIPSEYGLRALVNPEKKRPTMRGFKIAHADIAREFREAADRLRSLEQKRAAVPKRLPVGKIVQGPVVKLAAERKLLTNLFKMLAFQVESELVGQIRSHYRRAEDEGRTLIQSILAAPADISLSSGGLRILVHPLSSAHRTRALVALCDDLNRDAVCFPGTRLRLRYGVAEGPKAEKADRS
jgi:transposase